MFFFLLSLKKLINNDDITFVEAGLQTATIFGELAAYVLMQIFICKYSVH